MRPASSTTTARVHLLLAAVCVAAAVWWSFDNPSIDDTVRGDGYTCAAPWDTAWNGEAPNVPGGEGSAGDIVDRCTEAGEARFLLGVTAMTMAAALAVGAGVVTRNGRRRSDPGSGTHQDRRTARVG